MKRPTQEVIAMSRSTIARVVAGAVVAAALIPASAQATIIREPIDGSTNDGCYVGSTRYSDGAHIKHSYATKLGTFYNEYRCDNGNWTYLGSGAQ
jgi:hypothetical protein